MLFRWAIGFAAWNQGRPTGKIEGGKRYDFEQATYLYERPILWTGLALTVEPFASYVSNPNAGADFGVGLGFSITPFETHKEGFYLMGGSGMAYSTIGFHEQGTHLFFIGQGGIGYRSGRFFIENRFRHFSNGGTASPKVGQRERHRGGDVFLGNRLRRYSTRSQTVVLPRRLIPR